MDDTKKQQRTYKVYLTENEVKFITQSLQGKWEFYEKIKEDCDENLSELIKHLVEENKAMITMGGDNNASELVLIPIKEIHGSF